MVLLVAEAGKILLFLLRLSIRLEGNVMAEIRTRFTPEGAEGRKRSERLKRKR
jgi:hypothetical protein